jgi:hypothetical protein
VYDEIEILREIPPPPWPLHPRPRHLEHLGTYVRRLADHYETGLRTFCRHGLGCELEQLAGLDDDPPGWVFERLAEGTGLPVRHFRNMTAQRCYARMTVSVRHLLRHHPELVPKRLE